MNKNKIEEYFGNRTEKLKLGLHRKRKGVSGKTEGRERKGTVIVKQNCKKNDGVRSLIM